MAHRAKHLPEPALGRPAAARRRGARAGGRPVDPAGRRAHREPRLQERRRRDGACCASCTATGSTHLHGDARPALRAPRRPHDPPVRRPDRRGEASAAEAVRGLARALPAPARRRARSGARRGSPPWPLLTIGLGLGANTTIFSVLDAVVLEPMPGRSRTPARWCGAAARNFDKTWVNPFRDDPVREAVPVDRGGGLVAGGPGQPHRRRRGRARRWLAAVSASLFLDAGRDSPVLVRVPAGGGPRRAVRTSRSCRTSSGRARYAGDAAIVGRSIEIDKVPHHRRGRDAARLRAAAPTSGENAAEPDAADGPAPAGQGRPHLERRPRRLRRARAPGAPARAAHHRAARAAAARMTQGRPVPARVRHGRVRGLAGATRSWARTGPRCGWSRARSACLLIACANVASLLLARARGTPARDGGALGPGRRPPRACWASSWSRGSCSRGPARSWACAFAELTPAGPGGDGFVPAPAGRGRGRRPARVRLRAGALDGDHGAVRAGAAVPRRAWIRPTRSRRAACAPAAARPGAAGAACWWSRRRRSRSRCWRRARACWRAACNRSTGSTWVRLRPCADRVAHAARGRLPDSAGHDPVLPRGAGAGARCPASSPAGLLRKLPLGQAIGDRGVDVGGYQEDAAGAAADWQVASGGAAETLRERLGGRALPLGRRRGGRAGRRGRQRSDGAEVLGGTPGPERPHARGSGEGRPWVTVVGIVRDVKPRA